jgi:hypothetical protein
LACESGTRTAANAEAERGKPRGVASAHRNSWRARPGRPRSAAWTSPVASTRRRGSGGGGSEASSPANGSSSESGRGEEIRAGKEEVKRRLEIAAAAAAGACDLQEGILNSMDQDSSPTWRRPAMNGGAATARTDLRQWRRRRRRPTRFRRRYGVEGARQRRPSTWCGGRAEGLCRDGQWESAALKPRPWRRRRGGQREKPCSSGRGGSEESKATLTRKHSATTHARTPVLVNGQSVPSILHHDSCRFTSILLHTSHR